jgi:hypothetical protein
MQLNLRRTLAGAAVSTLLAGGALVGPTLAGPAFADDSAPVPSAACTAATAQVTSARTAVVEARKAYVAANRPLGKLVAAERATARTEVRTSRTALRQLQKQLAKSQDKGTRASLIAQAKKERTDIRHATRLLDSKAALLAQIKADRKAAGAAFAAARTVLATARTAAAQACGGSEAPVDTP